MLILEMRDGETLMVNGAAFRFRSRCRVEFDDKARFLFGRQVMKPEDATTPVRRLYLALQRAYVGKDEEREEAFNEFLALAAEFQATASEGVRSKLDKAMVHAGCDEFHKALVVLRGLMMREDAEAERH